MEALSKGLEEGLSDQVLLGITGSGKTFTMAKIIEKENRPALILAHNKTLAAQLYAEMKEFFPENTVEYFVSYYDYYQPEAYIPRTDTYIEKDSAINEQIDRMRHSATRHILERRDVIIVASVSCIYGLGESEFYSKMTFSCQKDMELDIQDLIKRLTSIGYTRNDIDFDRGAFRVKGDVLDIFPVHYEDRAWRLSFFGDTLESIDEFDPLTGKKHLSLKQITFFPANHYITPRPALSQALITIKEELKERLAYFEKENKLLEKQRLKERVRYDIEMLESVGMCKGIENYSRHLTGRKKGEAPPTLFEYIPKDAILFVDESHVTIPQLSAMYKGDLSRKSNLAEYGFRLESCKDNRPLKFEEWEKIRPQTIFVSATPRAYELEKTHGVFVEQIIRPTGLLDPECFVRPAQYQVDDLMHECKLCAEKNERVLVTTLTKKMAESLTDYLAENGLKVRYLHSDIDTLERIQIIRDLRKGIFDVLVGINLLREGLDIPECALVAILDADKEGFLRSETSLIQTIGRAARNENGRVLLYADKMTDSLKKALDETKRRREKQILYNKEHNITPKSIQKEINTPLEELMDKETRTLKKQALKEKVTEKEILKLEKEMKKQARDLNFEKAIELREQLEHLRKLALLYGKD